MKQKIEVQCKDNMKKIFICPVHLSMQTNTVILEIYCQLNDG